MQKNLFIRGGINITLLLPLWFWVCDTMASTFEMVWYSMRLIFLPVKNDFLIMSHNKWVITDEWKNWSNCDCTKRICPTSYCNPHFADTARKPLLIKPDVTIPINALSTKDFLFGIHNNDSRRIEVDRVSYGDSKSRRVSICSISRHSFSNFQNYSEWQSRDWNAWCPLARDQSQSTPSRVQIENSSW